MVDRGNEFPSIRTKSVYNGHVNIVSYGDHTQRRRKLVALSSEEIFGRHRLPFFSFSSSPLRSRISRACEHGNRARFNQCNFLFSVTIIQSIHTWRIGMMVVSRCYFNRLHGI